MTKYRVGVIGCGGIGIAHASGLAGLNNTELVAGCDISLSALQAFKEHWADTCPDLALYTDHRDMLVAENLDIVTVATPDDLHADPVVNAANAGVKGIFCEKPMATNLADADRIMEAVERNSTLLSIDHTRRWQPLWRHLREEIIQGGMIGSLQHLVGTLSGPRASLFRNGTHLIDAICYLAGGTPQWVFAELEAGYDEYTEYRGDGGRDPTLEPAASGYIHFDNGVRGFYAGGSKNTPRPKWRFEIVGSTGYVLVAKEAVLYKDEAFEVISPPEWPVSGIPAGVQELVRLLDEGGEAVSPARDALKVVEIMVGFLESQRLGNVRVPIPVPRPRPAQTEPL